MRASIRSLSRSLPSRSQPAPPPRALLLLATFLTAACNQGDESDPEPASVEHAQTGDAPAPFGWDYGLEKRCAATPPCGPNGSYACENAWFSRDECNAPEVERSNRWTVCSQSEHRGVTWGQPCHSFPIGDFATGRDYQFEFVPAASGWTAHMQVGVANHPGGSGFRNFFGFYDHSYLGGGPLPPANRVSSSHTVWYDDACPSAKDSSRLVLGVEWYLGKVKNSAGAMVDMSQVVEVLPASCNWPDDYTSGDWNSYVHYYSPGHDCTGCNNLKQYVVLTGAMFGVTAKRGETQDLAINWEDLRRWSVEKGFLSEQLPESRTNAIYLGVETLSKGVGNLYAAQFRAASGGH